MKCAVKGLRDSETVRKQLTWTLLDLEILLAIYRHVSFPNSTRDQVQYEIVIFCPLSGLLESLDTAWNNLEISCVGRLLEVWL